MREFTDASGRGWIASVREEGGPDYKGRFFLVLEGEDRNGDPLELRDVRWNSERTARRTLETMSVVELRRRLRAAAGRHAQRRAG
jgi:hypothetical protein